MRQLLQRASAHIAESPAYRRYPIYAFLLVLTARVFGYWPVDVLWWMVVVTNPFLDGLHLVSVLLPLWIAVVLGTVGLFRRSRWARLVSVVAVCAALDSLARWHFWPWHPLERLQDLAYAITVGLPIDWLMDTFQGDDITVTQAFALYLLVLYLCLRPLMRRGVGSLAVRVEILTQRWPRLNRTLS